MKASEKELAPVQASVIVIGGDADEIEKTRRKLEAQTCQDFEFIGEIGQPGPATWRRAIARAQGEVLVFLEAPARPVNARWLEELLQATDGRTIVKGLEVTSTPLDPSSLAGRRQAFVEHQFDESYPWAEDTELFCRLQAAGYRFVQLESAAVIHPAKPGSRTVLRRAFRYGIFYQRLRKRYPQPVELNSIRHTFKLVIAATLNWLGMILGSWFYRQRRY